MCASHTPIRIGTRGSPLALWQARAVAAALPVPSEIVVVRTSGDWRPADGEGPLNPDAGGKALFARELEEALAAGAVDCAAHSVKDLAAALPGRMVLAACLPRGQARDALVGAEPGPGTRIGTASPRRAAFIVQRWPDAQEVSIRGNVGTRIEKLDAGQVDALVLAAAGLQRLGLADRITRLLSMEEMLPAAGQGAVGIEVRDDSPLIPMLRAAGCGQTLACVTAERACVAALGGDCHSAIAAHATPRGRGLHLRAWNEGRAAEAQGLNPIALGRAVAAQLKA